MLIFLDRQHAGKPNRLSDRGAGLDLNENGRVDWWEKEAIWTGILSIELELLFLEMGYDVLPISDGKYSDRHKRVNEYSKGHPNSIYLALHLNSGGGNYGSFFYHHASPQGRLLAGCISNSCHDYFQQIGNFKAIAASSSDWTKNAWNTIKGVGRPVAVCLEPIFMDTHKELLSDDGMMQIAVAISQGVKKWMQ